MKRRLSDASATTDSGSAKQTTLSKFFFGASSAPPTHPPTSIPVTTLATPISPSSPVINQPSKRKTPSKSVKPESKVRAAARGTSSTKAKNNYESVSSADGSSGSEFAVKKVSDSSSSSDIVIDEMDIESASDSEASPTKASSKQNPNKIATIDMELNSEPSSRSNILGLSIKERLQSIQHDESRHARFVKKMHDMEKKSDHLEKKERKYENVGPGVVYTPLEKQYLEFKRAHPDLLLLVENGYKYNFFGKDAEIASVVLNIHYGWGKNFLQTSVPVFRLPIYVSRLVQAGHKVGVVKQVETRALKKIGDNKSGPFQRELTAIYTKSTLIGPDLDPLLDGTEVHVLPPTDNDDPEDGEGLASSLSTMTSSLAIEQGMGQYIMCLREEIYGENSVTISMVAVQTSTGSIIYDQFSDTFLRAHLETRLYAINPAELLLPPRLSDPTEKILAAFNPGRDPRQSVQIQRINEHKWNNSSMSGKLDSLASKNTIFSEAREYIRGLHPNLQLTFVNYSPFSSKRYMGIDGQTLKHLEILQSTTTPGIGGQGSLLWLMDHTVSAMGKRQLRQWLTYPLVDELEINERLDAVEYLADQLKHDEPLAKLAELMKSLPDLERGICRIYYNKCTIREFVLVMKTFERIAKLLITLDSKTRTPLLDHLFNTMPQLDSDLEYFFGSLNDNVVDASNGKSTIEVHELFRSGAFDKLDACRKKLHDLQQKFIDHLSEIRAIIGISSLTYKSVNKEEFLIEVPKDKLKRVPTDWVEISSTKACTRYRPAYVQGNLEDLEVRQELLKKEGTLSWNAFIRNFGDRYSKFGAMVKNLAVIDCLLSLAQVARRPGYCKPRVSSDYKRFELSDGRHPVLDALTSNYVSNSITMQATTEDSVSNIGTEESVSNTGNVALLTGPNMGGKSSVARMIALVAVMAHIGSFVPASSCRLSPFDGIYTRMGASDAMVLGHSTFYVELLETTRILSHATERSLVILDELGRGTSTHDGVAIAYAVLEHIVKRLKSYTLFITHYPLLDELARKFPGIVRAFHMGYLPDPEDETKITFLYKLIDGVEKKSYGFNVARLANVPGVVVDKAQKMAQSLREDVRTRQLQRLFHIALSLSSVEPSKRLAICEQIRYLDAM